MPMSTIHRATASLSLAAGLGLSAAAQAELTQYTHQVNASGQLNGQSFSNAAVTVVLESAAIVGDRLQAPPGPVSGAVDGNPGVAFQMRGGSFTFERLDSAGTFQATAVPVREPGTGALWLAGLADIGRVVRGHRA